MDGKLLMDAWVWTLNVSSAVVIIMVNKLLIGDQGYAFKFAATLSGLHFLASSGAMQIQKALGVLKPTGEVPLRDIAIFVLVNDLSIVSLNISLMVNTVGFYQIAKLLNIPFVCFVEWLWLKRQFTLPVTGSICMVVFGVAMVTVTDVTVSTMGLNVALLSVVAAGMQQVLCSVLQSKYKTSSSELLLVSGLPIGLSLVTFGPFVDYFKTGQWVLEFPYHIMVVALIVMSSSVAILVNISQFMCLGRFSAVAYQVMGHSKTFMVLAGGVAFFGETISAKQGLGMLVAVTGMATYGYFSSKAPPPQAAAPAPAKKAAAAAEQLELLLEGNDPPDEERGGEGVPPSDAELVGGKGRLTHRISGLMDSVVVDGVSKPPGAPLVLGVKA